MLSSQASRANHAHNLLRDATRAAGGVGRPQDWDYALSCLGEAADLGDERARAQLALLRDADYWRARADREALCEAPRVRRVPGFIRPQVCDWLVAQARDGLEPATMYNPETGRNEPHPRRTNSACVFDVARAGAVIGFLRERIAATVGIPAPCFEPTQVFHYARGQEIGPHFDFLERGDRMIEPETGRPYDGQRIATFLIYLNDGFEGGDTVFPKAGLRVRPAKGDALFFANVDTAGAPDPLSLHAGLPVLEGEKWIVSQWIHNRPFTASL